MIVDETVNTARQMEHWCLARELSGTIVRLWGLPHLWAAVLTATTIMISVEGPAT